MKRKRQSTKAPPRSKFSWLRAGNRVVIKHGPNADVAGTLLHPWNPEEPDAGWVIELDVAPVPGTALGTLRLPTRKVMCYPDHFIKFVSVYDPATEA